MRTRLAALTLACLGGAACNDDVTEAAGPPAEVRIVEGDGQRAVPGVRLGRPIVVEVRDADGRKVPGVTVAFTAEDGGAVEPALITTGIDGRAAASWTLGAATPTGVHRARAALSERSAVRFVALQAAPGPLPAGEWRSLTLATYEGSGQVVHPDVADLTGFGPSLPGHFLLAITPYPFGNATFENPSIFDGDGLAWTVPAGVTNPVARPAAGHLSDPDVVRDPATGRLRLYFREASTQNRIWLVESADGVQWGAPRLVVEGPNHTVLSPSVVRRGDGEWLMWAVDGAQGCSASEAHVTLRRSTDGISWSAPERVQLDQPGWFPWHIEVQWVPEVGRYWAFFNAKTPGSCATPALFLATSEDGVVWTTYPSPVLARGSYPEFADIVYRATFHYDAASDVVTLWHSGARYEAGGYVWRSLVEARTRTDLFGSVSFPGGPPIPDGTPGAPPLEDLP